MGLGIDSEMLLEPTGSGSWSKLVLFPTKSDLAGVFGCPNGISSAGEASQALARAAGMLAYALARPGLTDYTAPSCLGTQLGPGVGLGLELSLERGQVKVV